jgi:hypothetical protein
MLASGRAVWRALSSPYVDYILCGECAMKQRHRANKQKSASHDHAADTRLVAAVADAYRGDDRVVPDMAYWPNVYGSTPAKRPRRSGDLLGERRPDGS